MKHFIFGYGSLICQQSRAITAPTLKNAIAEPVVVDHIERIWSARIVNKRGSSSSSSKVKGWSPMGVRFRRGARCNGVLLHVDEEELARFDVRESGYERYRIDLADIHRHVVDGVNDESNLPESSRCPNCQIVFEKAEQRRREAILLQSNDALAVISDGGVANGTTSINVAIWVYVQSLNLPPNPSYPIPQTYVDVIMRGCLSISVDFARTFLDTTTGWWHNEGRHDKKDRTEEAHHGECSKEKKMLLEPDLEEDVDERHYRQSRHYTWVEDRRAPMYVRADKLYSCEMGGKIDEMIREYHSHALSRRVASHEIN